MAGFFRNIFLRDKHLSVQEIINKRTFISLVFFLLFVLGMIISWKWLRRQPLDSGTRSGIQKPLRTVLNKNEAVFSPLLSPGHLVKTYPLSAAAKQVRVNGNVGMNPDFDPARWSLVVIKKNGDSLRLHMNDIEKLPKTEIVFDFKCIEGWSQVTHWGGVKFSDFAKAFGLDAEMKMNYTGMHTPDNGYYVGIDNASMLHPQTILCFEMNGQPLPMNQGYPLRLMIPVKYGIKSIKRIGTIYFDNKRPPDYWFERGYDYYSGL